MPEKKDILVYGETVEGKLAPIAHELLGIGRILADTREEHLSIVIIDKCAGALADEAIAYGADKVFAIEDAPSDNYEGNSHAAIIEKLFQNNGQPAIMLFGQTLTGRDLAPRLAFRLKTGLVMDSTSLHIDIDSKKLIAKKPVAGGNVLATYTVKEEGVQMATVRQRAMEPIKSDDCRRGETIIVSADIDASFVKARLIEKVVEELDGPNLETAEIIVSGGRGIDTVEDFDNYLTNGLAGVLDAALGGTRAAVDAGLVSEQHQIGLTGKIVGPNLYFAVALSGAIQHITGCSGSRHIIAINKDENAQIFKFAEYGVVGDYKKILPPLTEKLKAML